MFMYREFYCSCQKVAQAAMEKKKNNTIVCIFTFWQEKYQAYCAKFIIATYVMESNTHPVILLPTLRFYEYAMSTARYCLMNC